MRVVLAPDSFKESMTAADAERYFRDYERAIQAIGAASKGRGVVDGKQVRVGRPTVALEGAMKDAFDVIGHRVELVA